MFDYSILPQWPRLPPHDVKRTYRVQKDGQDFLIRLGAVMLLSEIDLNILITLHVHLNEDYPAGGHFSPTCWKDLHLRKIPISFSFS